MSEWVSEWDSRFRHQSSTTTTSTTTTTTVAVVCTNKGSVHNSSVVLFPYYRFTILYATSVFINPEWWIANHHLHSISNKVVHLHRLLSCVFYRRNNSQYILISTTTTTSTTSAVATTTLIRCFALRCVALTCTMCDDEWQTKNNTRTTANSIHWIDSFNFGWMIITIKSKRQRLKWYRCAYIVYMEVKNTDGICCTVRCVRMYSTVDWLY